jgi:hypothetical protein
MEYYRIIIIFVHRHPINLDLPTFITHFGSRDRSELYLSDNRLWYSELYSFIFILMFFCCELGQTGSQSKIEKSPPHCTTLCDIKTNAQILADMYLASEFCKSFYIRLVPLWIRKAVCRVSAGVHLIQETNIL